MQLFLKTFIKQKYKTTKEEMENLYFQNQIQVATFFIKV